MKKLSLLVLALLLACSLTACGGGNSSSSVNGGAPTEGKAMTSLINWMQSGKFSYDFDMTAESEGQAIKAKGSMAMESGNIAVLMETTVAGQDIKSRIIMKDNTTYIVDDVNKLILKSNDALSTSGLMTDFSKIKKVGEGTAEINGKTLPYEDYTNGDVGNGATVRYFLNEGQVYGFVSELEGYKMTMIVTNPKDSVPAGAFDLPQGYTQM